MNVNVKLQWKTTTVTTTLGKPLFAQQSVAVSFLDCDEDQFCFEARDTGEAIRLTSEIIDRHFPRQCHATYIFE